MFHVTNCNYILYCLICKSSSLVGIFGELCGFQDLALMRVYFFDVHPPCPINFTRTQYLMLFGFSKVVADWFSLREDVNMDDNQFVIVNRPNVFHMG